MQVLTADPILLQFHFGLIILFILASTILMVAWKLSSTFGKHKGVKKVSKVLSGVLFCFFVVYSFALFIWFSGDENAEYLSLVGKDENQLALLEQGKITDGVVTQAYYEKGAPAGWKVCYDINAVDPSTGSERTYWGWSLGPKKYYAHLSLKENIKIIYDPCDPRVNSEIKRFLNEPSFRHTFEKAGKLRLLDKFRGEYEIEYYSFNEWFHQRIEK